MCDGSAEDSAYGVIGTTWMRPLLWRPTRLDAMTRPSFAGVCLAALCGSATTLAQIFDVPNSESATPTKGGGQPDGTGVELPAVDAYSYLSEICDGSAYEPPNLALPCNAVQAIDYECQLGPKIGLPYYLARYEGKQEFTVDGQTIEIIGNRFDEYEQSNSTQRDCICMSQYFDQSAACRECYAKHGSGKLSVRGYVVGHGSFDDARTAQEFSSSYCAATNTPTAGFAREVRSFSIAQEPTTTNPWNGYATDIPSAYESSLKEAASAKSSKIFTDPLANKTDVSLYYTPSVTGSAAHVVAEATGTAGVTGAQTLLTTNVVDGQIAPTASPDTTVTHTLPPSKYSERVEGLTANATAPPGPNSGNRSSGSRMMSVFCSLALIACVLF